MRSFRTVSERAANLAALLRFSTLVVFVEPKLVESKGPIGDPGELDALSDCCADDAANVHLLVSAPGRRHGGMSKPDSRKLAIMCVDTKCTTSVSCAYEPTKHSGKASTRRLYADDARPTTK